MISAEGTGKNIEKAIENALFELKASREDVDIKIINEGGLFKKAKVVVTISEDALPKYQKIDKIKKEVEKEENDEVIQESKDDENQPKQQVGLAETASKKRKASDKQDNTEKIEIEHESVSTPREIEGKVVDAKEFLEGFFKILGKDVEIDDSEDERYRHINVNGEDMGEIIGHRGEGYYAINRLITIMNGRENKKILLDIGGFKEKRAQNLTELAKRTARKVAKSGRYIKLNPMTPAERRVIHTALADDDRVTTLSKGTEPHRYVIIFPKNDDEF